jgi:hypothetical protein
LITIEQEYYAFIQRESVLFTWWPLLNLGTIRATSSLFRFAFVGFVLFRFHFVDFVSFRFVFADFVSFRFVSLLLISFRFVSFRFVFVDFVSFRFALYRCPPLSAKNRVLRSKSKDWLARNQNNVSE